MTLPHLHRLPESDESNPQPREYERHGGELRVPDNVQDTARRLPRQRWQCSPCLESYWQWPKNYNQAKCFHTNNTSLLVVFSSVLKMSVLTVDPVALIRYISWPNSGVTTKEQFSTVKQVTLPSVCVKTNFIADIHPSSRCCRTTTLVFQWITKTVYSLIRGEVSHRIVPCSVSLCTPC